MAQLCLNVQLEASDNTGFKQLSSGYRGCVGFRSIVYKCCLSYIFFLI